MAWADQQPNRANTEVVVTVKPIHSLVSYLLDGVTKPRLLLDSQHSPHTYQLKPDDARLLYKAGLVVWVGPTLEGFLKKPMEIQSNPDVWLRLIDHVDSAASKAHSHEADAHFWLDPSITQRIILPITTKLTGLYPDHSQIIQRNAAQLKEKLVQIDQQLEALFNNKQLSAIAYHDAWQHFMKHYGLTLSGIVSPHNQHTPGPGHLYALQQIIKKDQTVCLLLEPQYPARYLNALDPDKQLKHVTADPLGTTLAAGKESYFQILQQIADNLTLCLRH